MDIIDSQTVVVYDHSDLNTALSIDNGYIKAHLGASFSLTSGIRIHPDKPSMLISGIDPRDPLQTVHTLTDFNSNSATGCLYVNAASSIKIEIRDLIMIGRNYYGMPCIHDITGTQNVSVSYYNIVYRGPQITWHARGLTRYVDCDITIVPGYSPAEEVAQVCHLEIGGVTTISHDNSTSLPTFGFYNRNGLSLTILEDANVTITSVNDFFTAEGGNIPVILQPRANFNLTSQEAISQTDGYRWNPLHLMENSVFHYTRLSNSGNAGSLYISGVLTLESGADLLMLSDFSDSSGALLNFTTTAAQLVLNSPKRFALYNSGTASSARLLSFEYQTSFNFTCNQINYWRAAKPSSEAGTFDDPAPWRWYKKPKWGSFTVSGTAINTANGTNVISTNMTQEELDLLPPFSDMQFRQAKVFAVGVLPLHVNTVVGDKRPVTGASIPAADILVKYSIESTERRRSGRCAGNGNYSVAIEDEIPVNADVAVLSNIPFLLTEIVMEALAPGDLGIEEAPALITFLFTPISLNPAILPRAITDMTVTISDERVDVDRVQWVLWVKADGPLRTATGLTLPDSVVFIREGETAPITITEDFVSVHTAGPYDDVLFSIVWDNAEGVLARITAPIHVGETYTANLTWTVLPIGVQPEEGG